MVGKDKISREGIEKEIYSLSEQALSQIPLDRKRVLVVIPDTTRHAMLPLFFKILYQILGT